MKYSDLISFHPIEDVIQLVTADDKNKAREYVKTYVMSDTMAESLQAPVIDQLQMDEVVDNKGVLIVGNYGTGKSHLMSVISAIATDADNVQYLQNKKFAEQVKPIAGKFEVLRIEIGGVVMPLYDVIMGYVQEDFEKRGIDFPVPENRRAYNIQQFSNFRVAHVQEVGQKDNVAFPFGQSVKGFGKQFIFDEYIKAGHLKTEIIAFVFVRCEKLREFAFAQIRKRYFACCAFRKSAAVAFRFANQSFLC